MARVNLGDILIAVIDKVALIEYKDDKQILIRNIYYTIAKIKTKVNPYDICNYIGTSPTKVRYVYPLYRDVIEDILEGLP